MNSSLENFDLVNSKLMNSDLVGFKLMNFDLMNLDLLNFHIVNLRKHHLILKSKDGGKVLDSAIIVRN